MNGIESYTHIAWRSMKQRCFSINCKDYERYGGRGITVCPRWLFFANFVIDMGERPEGTTIERKDVNGNYEKSNCEWASPKDQAANRRNNRIISYQGTEQKLVDLCRANDLNLRTVRSRILKEWPEKDWFKEPWEFGTKHDDKRKHKRME